MKKVLAVLITKSITISLCIGQVVPIRSSWKEGISDIGIAYIEKTHPPFTGNPLAFRHLKDSLNHIVKKKQALKIEVEDSYQGELNGGTPNDNDIAVASHQLVTVQNARISVFAPDGILKKSTGLRDFAQLPLIPCFDPRIMYDNESKRWMVLFLAGKSYETSTIVLGISKRTDAEQEWDIYKLPGNGLNDDTWADFPALAINTHEVFFTVNKFYNGSVNNSGFKESVIYQVDKPSLLRGEPLTNDKFKIYHNLNYQHTPLFSIIPVKNVTTSAAEETYFLSSDALTASQSTNFYFTRLKGRLSTNPTIETQKVNNIFPYTLPPDARQKNTLTLLNTNDARILSARGLDGKIYFALNAFDERNQKASIYVGKMDILQNKIEGATLLADPRDIAFPNLYPITNGNNETEIVIAYLHASSSDFPGHSTQVLSSSLELLDSKTLKEGEDYLSIWGDYIGVDGEQTSKRIWVAAGYSKNIGLSGGGENSTWISKLKNGTLAQEEDVNVQLFPNPAKGSFEIVFRNPAYQSAKIVLTDATGGVANMLLNDFLYAGTIKTTIKLNVANGIYFLTIYLAEKLVATEKIVVTQ